MKKIILIGMFFIFLFSIKNFAQESSDKSIDEVIDNSVVRLQQKVLLDENQQQQISDLIKDKAGDGKLDTDDTRIIQEKIDSLLDPKQKAKYDIIKAEWWKSLVKNMPDSD